jgi:hypothetical protein
MGMIGPIRTLADNLSKECQGMGARFAGSQRLGDRRRRRLAVETDDTSAAGGWNDPLPAPEGSSRTAEGAHTAQPLTQREDHSLDLAAAKVVPREWWKYVAAGMACVAITTGILVAGWHASDLATALGPGVEGLFTLPAARVAKWFSSLLLSVAGQLALFIWWARSRSDKDFEGRYRLWIRVTCVWLTLGACVSTDAHRALRETLRFIWPEISGGTATLGWLVPVWVVGMAILIPLAREMRGCRWSRSLLLLGAGLYLAAAGLDAELENLLTPSVRQVLLEAALLAGHQSMLFSMWLHARHVLHCTVDPAIPSKSRWQIPRPHFRLPRLSRKRNTPVEPVDNNVPAPRVKRAPAKTELTSQPPAEQESFPSPSLPVAANDRPAAPPAEPAEADAVDAESEEFPARPDLRGLSKKQRRRLMQELRERERGSGR